MFSKYALTLFSFWYSSAAGLKFSAAMGGADRRKDVEARRNKPT